MPPGITPSFKPCDFTPPPAAVRKSSNGPPPDTLDDVTPAVFYRTPNITWVAPPADRLSPYSDGSCWIDTCWDDSNATPEQINKFLTRWPPSRTPEAYAAWISVDRSPKEQARADIEGLTESFKALVESGQDITPSVIDNLALKHNVLVGKWLIYVDSEQVDDLWAKIVRLVCLERKKGSAKVSSRTRSGRRPDGCGDEEGEGGGSRDRQGHLICVFTNDFRDEKEVMALRDGLRRAGVNWKIGFKADVYTELGIYENNPWNLHPNRYFI
ncbi:hypothetical protein NMY22_g4519 [Coprinellus aureogranulatus]|nr:hypothetical protein NMY22_g4519 [Coprinellus aureogranulatus]